MSSSLNIRACLIGCILTAGAIASKVRIQWSFNDVSALYRTDSLVVSSEGDTEYRGNERSRSAPAVSAGVRTRLELTLMILHVQHGNRWETVYPTKSASAVAPVIQLICRMFQSKCTSPSYASRVGCLTGVLGPRGKETYAVGKREERRRMRCFLAY